MLASPWSVRALRALVVVTCLVPLVQACGGRSDTEDDLYGSGDPITVAGNGSSAGRGGATAGGRGPGVSGSSAVGGSSVAGMSTGGASASGGSVSVAGSLSIGGATGQGGIGTGGGVPVAGSAGAAGSPSITCGSEVCDANVESCCLSGGFHCVRKGKPCAGAVLGCTTRADCGGDVCCLSITGNVADASSCKPSCNTGATRDRQLCNMDSDCEPPFRFCTPTVFGVNICTQRP